MLLSHSTGVGPIYLIIVQMQVTKVEFDNKPIIRYKFVKKICNQYFKYEASYRVIFLLLIIGKKLINKKRECFRCGVNTVLLSTK